MITSRDMPKALALKLKLWIAHAPNSTETQKDLKWTQKWLKSDSWGPTPKWLKNGSKVTQKWLKNGSGVTHKWLKNGVPGVTFEPFVAHFQLWYFP